MWKYDAAGNIQRRTVYSYDATTATANLTNGSIVGNLYAHEDDEGVWGDLLRYANDEEIGYDGVGNMLYDATRTYTWEHGRQLKTLTKSGTTWTFTYDANGMRTARSSGSTTYSYVYNGSRLSYMSVGSNKLQFIYGANGLPVAVTYNGTSYYYVTNIQGDVLAILNSSGTAVVTYIYDAWGNIHSTTGSMASTLGTYNPLRYRGYVYDQETGLYYLQSRYYNPELGRFISADGYVSTGQGFVGYNMFAYCLNNPVNYSDKSGDLADSYSGWLGDLAGELFYEWITGNEHPNHQARELENEITRQQNKMIADVAEKVWDAYQTGYALEQENIMLQAKLTIDMFDSPEDIERSIDIIEATVGFSIAIYEVATIVTVANPPAGAVVWAVVGVIWGGRAICRALQ